VLVGRVVAAEIRPNDDDQVLAIDVLDRWAAMFLFSVSTDGEFFAESDVAVRRPDGRWDSLGGGMRGGG
jgi:hypothetical protein